MMAIVIVLMVLMKILPLRAPMLVQLSCVQTLASVEYRFPPLVLQMESATAVTEAMRHYRRLIHRVQISVRKN